MSKNDDKIPILYKYKNIVYRILEIIYRQDDSIFFVIPRKNGFYLDKSSEKKYYKANHTIIKREFKEEPKKYENPKISFHPGKMIVHVNSNINHVKKDYKIYNTASGENFFCFLLQIIYPIDYSFFNKYNIVKNNSLLINDKEFEDLFEGKNLSLELFIHSKNAIISKDILPRAKRNYKYMKTYNSFGKYNITVSISELTTASNESVILNINTLEKNILLSLKPKKKRN